MRKLALSCQVTILSIFVLLSVGDRSIHGHDRINLYEDTITSQINLLNTIIKNPNAANMKNWNQLGGDSYDETELLFYMNSISDGTISAYAEHTATEERLVNHSRLISEHEPSVVLQYLRLALLAYNLRPGSEPPVFRLLSFHPSEHDPDEVIAECLFMVNNAAGHFVQLPAKVVFELGDPSQTSRPTSQSKLYLLTISIGEHIVYGWWYLMDLKTNVIQP
jgi:hypothetical protein